MRPQILATVLAAFTAIAATSGTASNDIFPPLEVTRTRLDSLANGSTTLYFEVHDPSKLTNATQDCLDEWKTNSTDYPKSIYARCSGNGTFAWRLDRYDSPKRFVIGLEHSFEDHDVGTYPYDYIANFASATFNSSNLECQKDLDGNLKCGQRPGSTVKAPITRSAAK